MHSGIVDMGLWTIRDMGIFGQHLQRDMPQMPYDAIRLPGLFGLSDQLSSAVGSKAPSSFERAV